MGSDPLVVGALDPDHPLEIGQDPLLEVTDQVEDMVVEKEAVQEVGTEEREEVAVDIGVDHPVDSDHQVDLVGMVEVVVEEADPEVDAADLIDSL